jgi:hypothetical protein
MLGVVLLRAAVMALVVIASGSELYAQVSGTVRDSVTGEPIAGAMVSRQAMNLRTVCDVHGAFVFDVPEASDVVIVGAAKGYFYASVVVDAPAADVAIALDPVPQDDDPSYQLFLPNTCSVCHPDQYDEWFGSPMHHAGTNTWVDDLFSGLGTPGGMGGFVYERDSIFAESNPASECAACHQPMRWINSPFIALADPTEPLAPDVLNGVSCDVCHKVADVDVSKINFPGIFPGAVTFTRPAGPFYHPVMYGRLGDVDFEHIGLMRASYQPGVSTTTCATCHQDASDPHGNHTYTGPISEPTYLEWLKSPYGDPESPMYQSCADCHMPPAGRNEACGILWPPLLRDPDTMRSHRIEGTTPEYLENALDVELLVERDGPYIEVRVEVINSKTGHHVPTGVTIRNVILLVEAKRSADERSLHFVSGDVVHELGGVGDPAQGYYAGLPGKMFAKIIEDFEGNAPTFFTDAKAIIFDNRIPALETDTSTYRFIVPGGGGEVQVLARAIYRRSFRTLVDAKQWTHDGHGNPLADVQPPHFGHLMDMAEGALWFLRGDGNGDGAVDLADFVQLSPCMLGPQLDPPSVGCLAFDEDGGGQVDLADFAGFQTAFGGTLDSKASVVKQGQWYLRSPAFLRTRH